MERLCALFGRVAVNLEGSAQRAVTDLCDCKLHPVEILKRCRCTIFCSLSTFTARYSMCFVAMTYRTNTLLSNDLGDAIQLTRISHHYLNVNRRPAQRPHYRCACAVETQPSRLPFLFFLSSLDVPLSLRCHESPDRHLRLH